MKNPSPPKNTKNLTPPPKHFLQKTKKFTKKTTPQNSPENKNITPIPPKNKKISSPNSPTESQFHHLTLILCKHYF